MAAPLAPRVCGVLTLLLIAAAYTAAAAAPQWDGELGAPTPAGGRGSRKLRQLGCELLRPRAGSQDLLPALADSQTPLRDPASSLAGATKSLVIAYGATPPTNIRPLLDQSPPLPKLDVTSAKQVELASLIDAASCIRTAPRVTGALVIWDDGTIPDLSALGNLKTVSGPLVLFGVNGNSSIASLAGLEKLESVGGFTLAHMNKIKDLTGLGRLTDVAEDLVIWDNDGLQSLRGIGPFTQLFSRLWIDTNPLLTDLTGLDSLAALDYDLVIRENPLLRTLDGLGALQARTRTVGGEVSLVNNFELVSTAGLKALRSVGISLAVMGHPKLEDLDGFSRIAAIPGDLVIYETSLESLGALSNIRSVGLNCVVGVNPDLESLEGLGNLTSVGAQLSISFNNNITSLKGLGNLQRVGYDLLIRSNAALQTLADLPRSLQSVGAALTGDLVITNNPALDSLEGLGAAGGALSEVAGRVVIADNGPGLEQAAQEVDALKAVAKPRVITTQLVKDSAAVAPVAARAAPPPGAAVAGGGAAARAAPRAGTAGTAAAPAAGAPGATNGAAPTRKALPGAVAPAGAAAAPPDSGPVQGPAAPASASTATGATPAPSAPPAAAPAAAGPGPAVADASAAATGAPALPTASG
ncbi:hypothetical protein MNEG_11641 [Monoraphidium neglectum]|uniref:Uncharacterized protein n=1 Tax=Monoraphidium neglectum TaxID=145388 RepID=A0A0D2MNP2_9CHLO|nr:hypothetical protein MNEG_11641 [Monoraphidium neglectum]KIY96320.1 hypothetical protein MNEG_11641 [Monoraphidium neglectum]|eukprot:XP_013895340.1 hypothetical protein MNEG_11641 [Monoraphidium neglectum]